MPTAFEQIAMAVGVVVVALTTGLDIYLRNKRRVR